MTAGNLQFTPAADSTTAVTIGFQVQDNGGTSGGGIDLDPTANTLTITLAAVNDAPSGISATVNGFEDQPLVFNTTNFQFTDTENNSLAAVKIASLPATGLLTLNNVAVQAGQSVALADIQSGNLRYQRGQRQRQRRGLRLPSPG